MRKKFITIRIERKLKILIDKLKQNKSYTQFFKDLLKKVSKEEISIQEENETKYPKCALRFWKEGTPRTYYCGLKTPQAKKLISLELCRICQIVRKLKIPIIQEIPYATCGGREERSYNGSRMIYCYKVRDYQDIQKCIKFKCKHIKTTTIKIKNPYQIME